MLEEAHMKTWERPRLIVLVRGRPEEALIIYCKGTGTGDPTSYYTSCDQPPVASATVLCNDCYMISAS
jgi:hypothetical protein